MPATNYGEQQQIANLFGKANQNPTAYYIGLLNVDLVWTPSTVVTLNSYCIPTTFNSGGTSQRIFKATAVSGTGTTGSSEPAWSGVAANGTIVDNSGANQITWTEQTGAFFKTTTGAWQGPEVNGGTSGLGYARVGLTNSQTGSTWSTPSLNTTTTPGTSVTWQSAISFGTSTASWKVIAGYILFDDTAANSGKAWHYGLLNSYLSVLSSGITVSIPTSPSPVTVTLT